LKASEFKDKLDALIEEHGDQDIFYYFDGSVRIFPELSYGMCRVDHHPYNEKAKLQENMIAGVYLQGIIVEFE